MLAEDAVVVSLMLITLRLIDRSALTSRNTLLSLDNIPNNFDPSRMQSALSNSSASAPSTTHLERMSCPTCGKMIADTMATSCINGSSTDLGWDHCLPSFPVPWFLLPLSTA